MPAPEPISVYLKLYDNWENETLKSNLPVLSTFWPANENAAAILRIRKCDGLLYFTIRSVLSIFTIDHGFDEPYFAAAVSVKTMRLQTAKPQKYATLAITNDTVRICS